MNYLKQAKLFYHLLATDLYVFKSDYLPTTIDNCIWIVFCTLSTAYILPMLGLTQSYGPFFLVGTIGSAAIFRTFGDTSQVVSDLDGDRTITYPLTLPLPGWLMIAQKGVSFGIQSALLSIIILPLGKILLYNQFDLSNFNAWQFIVVYLTLHLFTGFFSLFFISITHGMNRILNVWTRLLFPLWWLGCSQFTWDTLYQASPLCAYVCLANPFTYAFEALHAAVLGQSGYLPFWPCIGITLIWTLVIGYISIKKLQKRLDFI